MELPPEPKCPSHFKSCHDLLAFSLRYIGSNTNQQELLNKECVVCGLIENTWDHYQLPCQHYAHTRCMRHWLFTKQVVKCPWCQDSTPQTKYCRECQKWTDHLYLTEGCPIFKKFLIEEGIYDITHL